MNYEQAQELALIEGIPEYEEGREYVFRVDAVDCTASDCPKPDGDGVVDEFAYETDNGNLIIGTIMLCLECGNKYEGTVSYYDVDKLRAIASEWEVE